MQLIKDTIEIILFIIILLIVIYAGSYFQMKGWLHAFSKFIDQQIHNFKPKNHDSEER